MNLKRSYLPLFSIVYGIYNFFAISLLMILFISQRAWNPHNAKRSIRKTI
jgi:hypothetical protein